MDKKHGTYPSAAQIKDRLTATRDLIAYRIIISMPKCHVESEEQRKRTEMECLYDIANKLPAFLEERGFDPQLTRTALGKTEFSSGDALEKCDALLNEEVRPYYKDYISNTGPSGYQSLHVSFYDNISRCYIEVQLRTYDMDCYAEIGPANHLGYEKLS